MANYNIKDRVAVVTGGGSGIGEGIACLFAEEGAKVVVACRSVNGERVAEDIRAEGGEAFWCKTDVSKSADIEHMVTEVTERYGRIDILINNAGMQIIKPLWELDEREFDTMISTNLKGCFLCMKHVLPVMFKNKSGTVVNISSNLAFRALEGFAGYSATKGGIVAMSRTAALEAAKYNVRINCICPGTTLTPIMGPLLAQFDDQQTVLDEAGKKLPAGRIALPEDIANLALFLASDRSSMIYGVEYIIDGGASIHL